VAIGIGIFGAGRMGRLHAANIARRVPQLEVRVFAEPFPEIAAAATRDFGIPVVPDWADVLGHPDVDAVLVCSPPDAHVDQIVGAAEAGKQIFCEKPLASDLPSIDTALAAAERAGVLLQIGFNRRFDRNFAAVRDAVRTGTVGSPCVLKITSRDPEPPPPAYLPVSGGLFVDMTIHDFDLARFVTGTEVVEVSAFAESLVDPHAGEAGDVDTAVTSLRFDGGAIGVIDNCRRSAYGYDQRVEVHGTDGMVYAGNEVTTTAVVADGRGFHAPGLPHFFLDRYRDAYVREMESFAGALDGGPLEVSGFDARQATVAAIAAGRALAERRTVALAEVAT